MATKETVRKLIKLGIKKEKAEALDLKGINFWKLDLRGINLEGANLEEAKLVDADLRKANLRNAILARADLTGSDLREANLAGANLRGACLVGVDLRETELIGANLRAADLRGANLREAGFEEANLKWAKLSLPDLYILKQQPPNTLLRAFKLLTKDWESSIQRFSYKDKIGKWIECDNYDSDERKLCGKGFNVATLEWCLKNKFCLPPDHIIVEVEFYAKDIVAIPYATNGKFRVKRMRILGEVKDGELSQIIEKV